VGQNPETGQIRSPLVLGRDSIRADRRFNKTKTRTSNFTGLRFLQESTDPEVSLNGR